MFANRFTAVVDACSLVPALSRNLLLTMAEAEFYRLRWSVEILDEVERAITKLLSERGDGDAASRAGRVRRAMEAAFEDAAVTGHEALIVCLRDLPDPGDAHVLAAAIQTRASVIVTENLRHFPEAVLRPFDLEAKSADAFLADAIDLDVGRGVAAVRRMRERLKRPEKTQDRLMLDMEAAGFVQTVDALRGHALSL